MKKTHKCLPLLAILAMTFSAGTATGQTFVVSNPVAPKIIDNTDVTFFGANAAEIGNWQYIYDVNVTGWNFAPRFFLQDFDTSAIVNQDTRDVSGITFQKWDERAANTTNTQQQKRYGSFAAGGTTWVTTGIGTGVGDGIINHWHDPSDYTSTGGFSNAPNFRDGGVSQFAGPGLTSYTQSLSFGARVTTSTALNGLIATVRIVHPNSPGLIKYTGQQFGAGTTGTVLGPAFVEPPAVPEPSAIALAIVALAGLATLRHRRQRS